MKIKKTLYIMARQDFVTDEIIIDVLTVELPSYVTISTQEIEIEVPTLSPAEFAGLKINILLAKSDEIQAIADVQKDNVKLELDALRKK